MKRGYAICCFISIGAGWPQAAQHWGSGSVMIFPFFFLEAATAGASMRPDQAGRKARAARRRGRALKAAKPSPNGPAALFWGKPLLRGNRKRSCARDALCQGCSNSRPAMAGDSRRERGIPGGKHHSAQRAGPHVRPVRSRRRAWVSAEEEFQRIFFPIAKLRKYRINKS